jgi:hypothetical protein
MPNAVKSPSLLIPALAKTSNITSGYILLAPDGGIGPTSVTGWYNGITPQPGKYIVYYNTFSGPLIYAPQSDAELIRLANSFGFSVSTVAEALNVFSLNSGYFVANKAYPNIITENLVYLIDSTFTTSYPGSGLNTVPLRDPASVGNGTLQNGVGFNSDALSFIFDGSDDQIPLTTSDNFQNIDFSTGFTLMVLYKIDAVTDFNGQFRCMIGVTGGSRTWNYYLYGPSNPATTLLYHFSGQMSNGLSSAVTVTPDTYHLGAFTIVPGTTVGTYHHDGVVVSTQEAASSPSYTTAGGTQYIGRGDNMWKGNIAKVMIYNKALTQAEIYQTYYQGNIVTNNLTYIWDAGNLVSYPGSGVTTYNMTGSIAGNLQNGVGFDKGYGGYWSFDGTNDRILLDNSNYSFSLGNGDSNWTVNAWVRTTTTANALGAGSVLSNSSGGPVYSMMGVNSGKIVYWTYQNDAWSQKLGSTTVNDGNWHMLTWVNFSNTTMAMYVDGVLDTNVANSTSGNNNPIDVIGGSWAAFFQGDIAMIQVYQGKAFNPSEVNQNFSAHISRFK